MNAPTRHWPLPDAHNIRDLGGYDRDTGGITQWRRLLRGEALHSLNAQSVDNLVDNGLSLVIDLRGPHETGLSPHPFRDHPDVVYRNIVLYDAMAPIGMSEAPFDMGRRYCDALDRCGPQLAEVWRSMIAAPAGMVLFHCTAGKDRTGVVAALVLRASGVGPDDIAADYALTASAEGLIVKLRERALIAGGSPEHVERVLASDAASMLTMLAYLDTAHGGIGVYLRTIGLSPAEITKLVDRLCA